MVDFTTDSRFNKVLWFLAIHKNPDCIPPVRFQGNLNCCYAFAAVDIVFSSHLLLTREALKGSEQELSDRLHTVYPPIPGGDATANIGNTLQNALNYIINEGLALESDWPYKGRPTYKHDVNNFEVFERIRQTKKRIYLQNFSTISDGDHEEVQKVLHRFPVAARITHYPSLDEWRIEDGVYLKGTEKEILVEEHCKATGDNLALGHAVVLFGYGEDDEGIRFYVAKNSYGDRWGYKGYVWIKQSLCSDFHYASASDLLTKEERAVQKKKEEKFKNFGNEDKIKRQKKED